MSFRGGLLACLSLCAAISAGADPVPVKHLLGDVHAYLTIRDDNGKLLGYADEVNARVGRAWRSRMTMHFFDGSLSDETATYTQGSSLKLLTDHSIQKGPAFSKPSDVFIDVSKGQVTYHETKDGKDEVKTDTLDLPPDLANGILSMVLQNFPRGTDEVKVGYLVTMPKPRVVKFAIHHDGQASYYLPGGAGSATHFRIHVEIGGVAGVIAPVIGKEPPDLDAWVTAGEAPTFLKLHGTLFIGGPQWTLQLTSPEWRAPHATGSSRAGAQ